MLLSPGTAASWHRAADAFEILFTFESGAHLSKQQKLIRSWLRDGYSPTWVPPDSVRQLQHPQFKKKRAVALAMLSRAAPGSESHSFLMGDRPHAISLGNLPSAAQHVDFVASAVAEEYSTGAMRPWHAISMG